ncbi:MAG TPA: non-ribosomal peptide synthetase, partial [Planctomycetaceae bacterium]|nr:non-ribosomal peptide synthetase [Planctomycetaceae bacterium]
GWSLAVFCGDLGKHYQAALENQTTNLTAAAQYPQYAAAMAEYGASDRHGKDVHYWVERYPGALPVVELPTEFPRRELRTYPSKRFDQYFEPAVVEKVRKLGAKQGCSLFNTFFAAFNAYIGRISNSSDVVVGVPSAGQAATEMPDLIGFCVNTLPVRSQLDFSQPFTNLLSQVRSNLLDAFDHQRLSFGELLRELAPPRDPSRPPLVSISFNLDPTIDTSEMGFDGIDVNVRVEPRCFEQMDWFINGVIQDDQSVELQIQYNSDLYSETAIRFYFEGFATFLEELVTSPERPVSSCNLMSVPQRQQLLVDWNNTDLEIPDCTSLHQLFSHQAAKTPDAIAVEHRGSRLTYAEVDQRSNQIAHFLASQGIVPGDLVGICVERSEDMLVTLYGILKSGAGYVPLDPGYPADRLEYMCQHSNLKLVVTQDKLTETVAKFGKPLIAIDANQSEFSKLPIASPNTIQETSPGDICYVIYTSGSTGKPKGVQVPHGAVVNFLATMQASPGFGPSDSILAVTTLSFDIAVLELYLPTVSGGRTVILDSLTATDGAGLAQALDRHNISLLQATPTTWRLLIESGWQGRAGLKALCGGEPMPNDIVAPLLERCDELWNMYGPTETTVWSAVHQIVDANSPILIGRPVGNTQIFILDENAREVPLGCEGELHIGGAGVTLGYRSRPELTDERFINNPYSNPFTDYVSRKLYKTGDIAKIRFDGQLEFLRRNDKQVKVRGFRIELGEIEQTLDSHAGVRQNVVVVREDAPGDTRLVAYIVPNGEAPSTSQLREHLRDTLPNYMVPQHFVVLDIFPQTNNGKIDYKQLPAPSIDESSAHQEDRQLPTSAAEAYILKACTEHLGHNDVFMDDTFFDVGGHSMLVMQIIVQVERDTQIRLGPQDFLVNTISQLAAKITQSDYFSDADAAKPLPESLQTPTQVIDPVPDSKPAVLQPTNNDHLLTKLKRFWN